MLRSPRDVAAIALALILLACDPAPPAAPPLNSERIEQVFGSYGVEVLMAEAEFRVSSLYSTDDGVRTTRTLAVVAWPAVLDPRLSEVHAEILAGASIGATLEAAGWAVEKRNLSYHETPASEGFSRLMRIPPETLLATHGYSLVIEREGHTVHYATIVEIHHPDYLDLAAVKEIYGRVAADDADAAAILLQVVNVGLARVGAQLSGRGE